VLPPSRASTRYSGWSDETAGGDLLGDSRRSRAAVGPGDQISTEDLRVILQRYRSFFEPLLKA
jgi:hypothetical protein